MTTSKANAENNLGPEIRQTFKEMDQCTLMVHEFIYLMCNASDRIAQIEQNHSVNYKSEVMAVSLWEIDQSECQ